MSNDNINYISKRFNFRNMPINKTRNEIKSNVIKWLLEEGYKSFEESDPTAIFKIRIEDPSNGFSMGIYQPVNSVDKIVLGSNVILPEEFRGAVRIMEKTRRLSFLWDIRFALLKEKMEFSGVEQDTEAIHFNTIMYFDEIKKSAFMEKIRDVFRIMHFLLWMYLKELGEPMPPENVAYS